jgi:hypothetical protein
MANVYEQKTVTLTPDMARTLLARGGTCAWDGCTATYTGDQPRGWINLLTYWSPKPAHNLKAMLRHCQRDAVLCPEHSRALEGLLKDLGRALDVPPAGAA